VLLAIAAATLIADQVTKFLVVTYLAPHGAWAPIPALSNFFTIEYTTNTGAAFGLFKDWGTIFIGVAVVVIAAIIIYQNQVPQEAWLVRLALGLQLGGAMGNLTDRLRLGHVTDFIYFHFWPLFNVADMSIVTGVILLALTMLREEHKPSALVPKPNESADSNPPASV
jgi:signal peptidase II